MRREYQRASRPGQTRYEQLLGPVLAGTETPRQRYLREHTTERFMRRDDRHPDTPISETGIGTFEGFRIIVTPFPTP